MEKQVILSMEEYEELCKNNTEKKDDLDLEGKSILVLPILALGLYIMESGKEYGAIVYVPYIIGLLMFFIILSYIGLYFYEKTSKKNGTN